MIQFRRSPHQDATTQTQSGAFATTGAEVPVGPDRVQPALTLRAVWSKFRAAERRFSASIWGDLLGCACLAIIFVGLAAVLGVKTR